MKWKRSDSWNHYLKLKINGSHPEIVINQCLLKGIRLKSIKYISHKEITVHVAAIDFDSLKEIAGNRFEVCVCGTGGVNSYLKKAVKNKLILAGVMVFCCILFYQSLFINEIEITGYESISEQSLRNTLEEAGFYEGCRKSIELDRVKLYVYEEYENIAWIGIKYKGNLAHVSIAESGVPYEKRIVKDNAPCNIVAAKDGYISRVIPAEGIQVVKKGQYVKAGDIIISGEVPLEGIAAQEAGEKVHYVHAGGTVEAKIPVRLNFYSPASDIVKKNTGRSYISLAVNGTDIVAGICPFETAKVRKINLLDLERPTSLKLQLIMIDEVEISGEIIDRKQLKNRVINEIHKYVEEKLPESTQILNNSLNFTQEKNIISVGVTLETLQQIGTEEEISVDKSNGKSEENDNQ